MAGSSKAQTGSPEYINAGEYEFFGATESQASFNLCA